MNKSELIAALAAKHPNMTEKDITSAVNHIISMMIDSLCNGKRIEIRGFGSFCLRYHAPRNAHNPKTGAKVLTKGKYSPHFKAGKELKDRVEAARKKNQDEV